MWFVSMILVTMILTCSFRVMISMILMTLRGRSTDFMELDTIVCIIFRSIKSNMWEIVPDGEDRCIHEIRYQEFIEHENHSERDERILMTHDESVIPRTFHHLSVSWKWSQEYKYRLYLEHIGLFYEIDTDRSEGKEEVHWDENIHKCIECRLRRLTDHQTSMYRKEYRQYKYEVHGDTDEKDRESEWKECSLCPKWRIPDKENDEEYIYSHADNSTECCLENTMQSHEIIQYYDSYENESHNEYIEFCHLKCRRKRREEWHMSG